VVFVVSFIVKFRVVAPPTTKEKFQKWRGLDQRIRTMKLVFKTKDQTSEAYDEKAVIYIKAIS